MVEGAQNVSLLRQPRWSALDRAVALYTVWTAILIAVRHPFVEGAGTLLVVHASILLLIAVLPPRGARWESVPSGVSSWRRHLRGGLRFLRYTYPLILVLFFFEEVMYTVNAIAPASPYWFEPYLYAADRWLFGELPALLLAGWTGAVQDEVLHAFYFSYYLILVVGTVVAWLGQGSPRPGPAFETVMTTTVFAFLLCFVWYPFLPARGPWENPALMAGLPEFEGWIFTPVIEWIITRGAVSGGCFPSSHVAASWGVVLGLAPDHRRAAWVLGLAATGMSVSCVYTRYHHAVDVVAGLLVALLAQKAWRYVLTRSAGAAQGP